MSNTVDLSNVKFPDVMDLRTAALYLGVSEMRVRTLARDGGIAGTKEEGSGKWLFTKLILDGYKNTPRARKSGGGRVSADGKAWVINIKPADYEKVVTALKAFNIELKPRYNYAAQKAYRIKRAADLKAKGLDAHGKKIVTKGAVPVQK